MLVCFGVMKVEYIDFQLGYFGMSYKITDMTASVMILYKDKRF